MQGDEENRLLWVQSSAVPCIHLAFKLCFLPNQVSLMKGCCILCIDCCYRRYLQVWKAFGGKKYLWYLKSIIRVLAGVSNITFAMCYCQGAGVKQPFSSHCSLEYGTMADLSLCLMIILFDSYTWFFSVCLKALYSLWLYVEVYCGNLGNGV